MEEIKPQKAITYNDLEIYKTAHALAVEIHQMSLTLPRVELYEEGQQIRRAAKSISANIVEGFGRRRYKLEFIRFLVFAHASCDEMIEHLRLLLETKSLDAERAAHFLDAYNNLGRKPNRFIEAVEKGHKT